MSRQAQGRDWYLDRTGQERSVRKKIIQIARRWMIVRIADYECEHRRLISKHGEAHTIG